MDWLEDLKEKFSNEKGINNLKEGRFHGYVQINFFNGRVVDINKRSTLKPDLKK